MPKQGSGTSGRARSRDGRTLSLPDLAGVDLHELRVMEDPALLAAVDEVLRGPELFDEMWAGNGGEQGGVWHPVPPGRRPGSSGA